MRICIVGAGVTGLVAASMLVDKGHSVTVYEREKEPGGLASTTTAGNERIEKFYHHIFTSDANLIDLIDKLGLTSELMWLSPKNSIYINNHIYPFTSPMDLLMFKELPLHQRILMGLLVYRAKLVSDWKKLENINSKEWIIKNAGQAVYDKVWGPLLNSKFDIDADKVSAVWIWNKFKLRGSTRSKNLSGELLGYMKGSFGKITEALVGKITTAGSKVTSSCGVTKIGPNPDGTLSVTTSSGIETFDKVLVTAAPKILKHITPAISGAYLEKLDKIKYKSNICMMLELKKPVSSYYWTTIADTKLPFVLFIEHSNLTPKGSYSSSVVYLSRYLDTDNPMFGWSDQEIEKSCIEGIKKMFPDFDESDIIDTHITRAEFAQPVVVKEYSKIIPDYATPVDNLYLASMAQIYPEDRGLNYAVRMGESVGRILC